MDEAETIAGGDYRRCKSRAELCGCGLAQAVITAVNIWETDENLIAFVHRMNQHWAHERQFYVGL
ncbi:MAG: hypothetical protein ACLR0U_30120 [Enterocloster clostridioformis]